MADARELVHGEACVLVDRWRGLDPLVRADGPDAVHQMRVVTRRLRSLLATFRPLFDRAETDPVRSELKWYAAQLGAARDAEVVRDRLTSLAEPELPPALVVELTDTYRRAHDHLVLAMQGRRYRQLVDDVERLADDSPWNDEEPPAGDVLVPRTRREWRRLRNDVLRAEAAAGDERDDAMHAVRKGSKRVRYAAELVEPVAGGNSGRFTAAAKHLQSVLGDRQDGVMTQAVFRNYAERGGEVPGLLARERERTAAADAAFPDAWARLSERKQSRWLG